MRCIAVCRTRVDHDMDLEAVLIQDATLSLEPEEDADSIQ